MNAAIVLNTPSWGSFYTFFILSQMIHCLCAVDNDIDQRNTSELSGDSNAESMLIVEKGLRELAVLKVHIHICGFIEAYLSFCIF